MPRNGMAGSRVWSRGLGEKMMYDFDIPANNVKGTHVSWHWMIMNLFISFCWVPSCPQCGFDLCFYDHWVSGRVLNIFIGCLSFLWIGSSDLSCSYLCFCWLVPILYIVTMWNFVSSCLIIHIVILHIKLCIKWPLSFITYIFMLFKVSSGEK